MVNSDARDNMRQKLENDPDRDMSHVPGTYNPGNQAGKPVQGGGLRPADEPGGPFLGKGAGTRQLSTLAGPKIAKIAKPTGSKL